MDPNDEAVNKLFRRIAEHDDQKAFAVFFQQYHTKLLRYASLFVGSLEAAEDVVSDVLIKLLKNRQEAFSKDNFIGYLFQCVKNRSLDYLRKEKNKQKVFDANYNEKDYFIYDKQTPFTQLALDELHQAIRDLIENLPPKRRMVFQLIKDEGMSYKDVAGLMDISERTVEVHLKLAVKDIQDALEIYLNHSSASPAKKSHLLRSITLLLNQFI